VDRTWNAANCLDGKTAGVQLAEPKETIPCGRVILAAGSYGSPAILLGSGIGPLEALQELGIIVHQNLPGVGSNLQDHPLLFLSYTTTLNQNRRPNQFDKRC